MTDKTTFPVTGIILAGGKSARMGTEKGLLSVGGQTMVERVAETLQAVTDACLVISNTGAYDFLNLPVYADVFPETGPLGGIYTGLLHAPTHWSLVVACDMPLISTHFLEKLREKTYNAASRTSIIVPEVNGQLQPLCACYHQRLREQFRELIGKQQYKLQRIIREMEPAVHLVTCSEQEENNFVNINTPAELEQIQKKYEH